MPQDGRGRDARCSIRRRPRRRRWSRTPARAGAGRGGLATVRDPVGRFLAEARRYKRLSEQEERALGVAARERGDLNAARTLVVHNLRLVIPSRTSTGARGRTSSTCFRRAASA